MQELLDRDAQLSAKKPQLLEDLAHVVPGTTQQRIHRVTFDAFEEISRQSAIGLQVPDHWLHRIPALELSLDCSAHPALGSRNPDFERAAVAAVASVAPVRVGLFGLDA